jgi:hypothetical protein
VATAPVGQVEQPVAARSLVSLHQHIGPLARCQHQLLEGLRRPDRTAIGGDEHQGMPLQGQAVDAGVGGIQQAQPQQSTAGDRQLRVDLPVHREQATFPAEHAPDAHGGVLAAAAGVIFENQHAFVGGRHFRNPVQIAAHHQGTAEAAEHLIRREAVLVGVDVEEAGRVVLGEAEGVLGGPAGRHRQEHVVARSGGRDVEPVEVQVGGLIQTIAQPQAHLISGLHLQQRAG